MQGAGGDGTRILRKNQRMILVFIKNSTKKEIRLSRKADPLSNLGCETILNIKRCQMPKKFKKDFINLIEEY